MFSNSPFNSVIAKKWLDPKLKFDLPSPFILKDIDKAVESLREKLGNEVLVTSKIIPLSFFKTRKSIANTTINSVGARIVILPDIGDAVSDNLIHQLVLSASAPPKISVPICNNSISHLNFNEKSSIFLSATLDNDRPSKTTNAGEPGPGRGWSSLTIKA